MKKKLITSSFEVNKDENYEADQDADDTDYDQRNNDRRIRFSCTK